MREPPAISENTLLTALRAGYGLAATAVTFLPLGYDAAAAAYRVTAAAGQDYFLKLRLDSVNAAGLAVPHYLHAHGLAEVLAPLPALAGALWHPLDAGALILYPFLPDAVALPSGTADEHWRRLGATLRRVHETNLPPDIAAMLVRETFAPVSTEPVKTLDALVHGQAFDEPLSRELAEFWFTHAPQIRKLVARTEAFSQRLQARAPSPLVLCHADPHWSNVLIDAHDRLWLVDWDDTVLAVKERDLMFVIGGISADWGTPRDAAVFLEGYGPTTLDPLALAYYRAEWAVQDIGAYGAQVLTEPHVGEVTRRDALRVFKGLFGPGDTVDIALSSEAGDG